MCGCVSWKFKRYSCMLSKKQGTNISLLKLYTCISQECRAAKDASINCTLWQHSLVITVDSENPHQKQSQLTLTQFNFCSHVTLCYTHLVHKHLSLAVSEAVAAIVHLLLCVPPCPGECHGSCQG